MNKVFIPRIEFQDFPLEKESELFVYFLSEKRWISLFEKVYPTLCESLRNVNDKERATLICKDFIRTFRESNKDTIQTSTAQLQTKWSVLSVDFLKNIAEHFQTDWPRDKEAIAGYISILPVYPRFLDTYSFCVGYKDTSAAIETVAHEILHFLWFKKWSEVFPEASSKEFESPHLVWRLSEIMDPIILQCHPMIRELIKPKKWGYSSFASIKIGGVSMTDHFKKLYLDSVGAGDSFEGFLVKALKEAEKYKEIISTF
ncbi:MAG: hypothetical protein PHG25_01125 [Candidatus Pacebacteria bacterium]|nr:hypothetical protein [Candidatus Paceibacterota bacterium]